MTRDEIFEAALQLPEDERVLLAEELLSEGGFAPEVADEWIDEVRRRLDRIDAGQARLIPAEDAFALARARLREARLRRAS